MTVTDRPRYHEIAADYPWIARRGIPSGLHVHVGVGGPDEALAVYNAARGYLPEVGALAANSPFFEGADTGLASSRMKLADDQPRSGIPPAFRSWHALAEFVEWGSKGERFPRLDLPLVGPAAAPGLRHARVSRRRHADLGRAHGRDRRDLAVARRRSPRPFPRRRPFAGAPDPRDQREPLARAPRRARLPPSSIPTPVRPSRHAPGSARLLLELEPYAAELGCSDELALAWQLLNGMVLSTSGDLVATRGLSGLLRQLVEQTEKR